MQFLGGNDGPKTSRHYPSVVHAPPVIHPLVVAHGTPNPLPGTMELPKTVLDRAFDNSLTKLEFQAGIKRPGDLEGPASKVARIAQEVHPSAQTTPVGIQQNPLPGQQGLPINYLDSLQTGANIIQARNTLDRVVEKAADIVPKGTFASEAAQAAADIYGAFMNPMLLPVAGLYGTYRAITAPINFLTGRSEPVRPNDVRLTTTNVTDRLADSGIPFISQGAKLLNFIGF